jgi:hypothetical protein
MGVLILAFAMAIAALAASVSAQIKRSEKQVWLLFFLLFRKCSHRTESEEL